MTFIFLLISLLYSLPGTPSQLTGTPPVVASADTSDYETILPDEVRINGKLKFCDTKENLLKYLGKPDSVYSPFQDCEPTIFIPCGAERDRDSTFSYHYGKGIWGGCGNAVAFETLDLTQGSMSFSTSRLTMTKNTTFAQFIAAYPRSAMNKDSDEPCEDWWKSSPCFYVGVEDEEPLELYQNYAWWQFYFVNNKLTFIKYFVVC